MSSIPDTVTAAKDACYKLPLDDHDAVLRFIKLAIWFAFLGGAIATGAVISVIVLLDHIFTHLC